MRTAGRAPGRRWALTLAIRAALDVRGRFDAKVDERDAQAVLDLHWAARQAGRLLGVSVTVEFGAAGSGGTVVPATVRCVGDGRAGRARAAEGLQRLLVAVYAAQASTTCTPVPSRRVPRPRGAVLG